MTNKNEKPTIPEHEPCLPPGATAITEVPDQLSAVIERIPHDIDLKLHAHVHAVAPFTNAEGKQLVGVEYQIVFPNGFTAMMLAIDPERSAEENAEQFERSLADALSHSLNMLANTGAQLEILKRDIARNARDNIDLGEG